MSFVLGVDGGNTKTIALVTRLDGTIVGCGRSGNADIYNAGSPEAALASVDEAVTTALTHAGVEARELVSGGFSLAGADWPDDFELLYKELRLRHYGDRITVVNDSVGSLYAGSPEGWGVSVACGTGGATCARSKDGALLWHSSWWQPCSGASGLGNSALRAILDADLGIIGATALTEKVPAFFGLSSVEEVLYQSTKRTGEQLQGIDRLARVVLDLASEGDRAAFQIVCDEGEKLARLALAAARQVGIADEAFPLVLAGSVFRHQCTLLIDTIVSRVLYEAPAAQPLRSDLEPAAGAVLLALEAAGEPRTDCVRKRLGKTCPGAELFAT